MKPSVRLGTPRIAPMPPEERGEAAQAALKGVTNKDGQTLNIFGTFAHSPDALTAFLQWGKYILQNTDLSPREREILILRVGHLCRSGYEFHQHTRIGLRSDLSEADIEALTQPIAGGPWSETEALLIQAADDLIADHFISSPVWDALAKVYSPRQMMDIVFVVGQYTQVSMALNSFGVQIEKAV